MADDFLPATRSSLLRGVRDPSNADAWQAFVDVYGPAVRIWSRRMGLCEADSDDVAQRILMKLVKELQTFQYDPRRSFRAWLRRVTRNATIDYLRREGRQLAVATGDTRVLAQLNNAEDLASVADQLSGQLAPQMRRELMELAEHEVQPRLAKQWEVYKSIRDGLAIGEVAIRMEMSESAVRKAKSRVQRALRESVAKLLAHSQAGSFDQK